MLTKGATMADGGACVAGFFPKPRSQTKAVPVSQLLWRVAKLELASDNTLGISRYTCRGEQCSCNRMQSFIN